MLTVSNKLRQISKLVDKSRDLAYNGNHPESNNLYQQAYIYSKEVLELYDVGMFSDQEYSFLTEIIKSFEY
jgi:hypothetical protein